MAFVSCNLFRLTDVTLNRDAIPNRNVLIRVFVLKTCEFLITQPCYLKWLLYLPSFSFWIGIENYKLAVYMFHQYILYCKYNHWHDQQLINYPFWLVKKRRIWKTAKRLAGTKFWSLLDKQIWNQKMWGNKQYPRKNLKWT